MRRARHLHADIHIVIMVAITFAPNLVDYLELRAAFLAQSPLDLFHPVSYTHLTLPTIYSV